MMGMRGRSSSCEGMYKLIKSHGCKGWFAMRVIWRNGDMSAWGGNFGKITWECMFIVD